MLFLLHLFFCFYTDTFEQTFKNSADLLDELTDELTKMKEVREQALAEFLNVCSNVSVLFSGAMLGSPSATIFGLPSLSTLTLSL
jgi:hypothetical protein